MIKYIAAVLVALSTGIASADTYTRQPGIRIAHYTFDVTVGDTSN